MKINFLLLAKIYIVFFGLVHVKHGLFFLGILNDTIRIIYPNDGIWHLIMFFIYTLLPILTVLKDDYYYYMTASGFFVLRMVAEAVLLITDFYLITMSLSIIAISLCLILAIESVASRVAVEFLSLCS